MVMLQLWIRNLQHAHFGKARQCLIKAEDSASKLQIYASSSTLQCCKGCNRVAVPRIAVLMKPCYLSLLLSLA